MATRKNFPSRILQRQEEARARQEAHDKLAPAQKLEKATPGSKEHARLVVKGQK